MVQRAGVRRSTSTAAWPEPTRSTARRHGATYILAFVPCLIWVAGELSWAALAVAAGVLVPRVILVALLILAVVA